MPLHLKPQNSHLEHGSTELGIACTRIHLSALQPLPECYPNWAGFVTYWMDSAWLLFTAPPTLPQFQAT